MLASNVTGLMVYYYYVCKRKLWLTCRGISLESENEDVKIGRFLDENAYSKERKHICINNDINLDFIEGKGTIHEIKKSRSIEEASIMQVKYYLYYLKKRGVEIKNAKIDYPLLKKVIDVKLSEQDEDLIGDVIRDIQEIQNQKNGPKVINEKRCKKCAFYDLCYI